MGTPSVSVRDASQAAKRSAGVLIMEEIHEGETTFCGFSCPLVSSDGIGTPTSPCLFGFRRRIVESIVKSCTFESAAMIYRKKALENQACHCQQYGLTLWSLNTIHHGT